MRFDRMDRPLKDGIRSSYLFLFFYFFSTFNSTAQRKDITALQLKYQLFVSPATAYELCQAYQDQADWFREMPQFNTDSSMYYFKTGISLLENSNPVPYARLASLYSDILNGNNPYKLSEIDSVASIAWRYIEKISQSKRDKTLEYDILIQWAFVKIRLSKKQEALDLFTKAYAILKDDPNPEIQAKILSDKGNFYYYFGSSYNMDGYPYVLQSIHLYLLPEVKIDYSRMYWNYKFISWQYNSLEQYDSCDYYFAKAKALLPHIHTPFSHIDYYTNRGNVYSRQGKYDLAKQNLLLAEQLSLTYHFETKNIYQFLLSVLGVVAVAEKKYDAAIEYFKHANQIFLTNNPNGFDPDNYMHIAHAYEIKGDYKQALEYNKKFADENANLIQSQNSISIREQELKTNLSLQQREINQKRLEQNVALVVIGFSVLLLVLLTFFYYRIMKNNKRLEAQNIIIEEQAHTLRQLDANKTRFFTNISHELRTPLTLMLGPLNSVLKSNTLNTKNNILISMARQQAKQLMILVNEILDLTKSESIKMSLHKEPANVYRFFRRLISTFESYAVQRKVKLVFSIDAQLPHTLLMDRFKVERIFNNLLVNALKFTPAQGTIEVKILDESSTWTLSVADTGRGIHPDDLPHIFDRFYQGNHPDLPMDGGTGIGLALSKELALVMNGKLTVESKSGKGSVFKLSLPKSEVFGSPETTDILNPSDTDESEVGLAYALNYRNHPLVETDILNKVKSSQPVIMVVEDNLSLKEYIQVILSDQYLVIGAEHGQQALEILDINRVTGQLPDLIISDIMMPVMDGFQFLEQIKSGPELQSLPIIMLTARVDMQDRLKALRIGVDDYLTKPFEEEELLARVKNLLTNAAIRKQFKLTESIDVQAPNNSSSILSKDVLIEEKITITTQSIEDIEWLSVLETTVRTQISNDKLNVDFLANLMHISRAQFFRRVQSLSGLTPLQYIQEIRYNHARVLLEQKRYNSVKSVAAAVGIQKVQYFSEQFKERFGKSPSEYLS